MFQEIASWFAELGITYKVLSGGGMKSKMYAEKEDVDILIASLGALSKLTTVGKQCKIKMICELYNIFKIEYYSILCLLWGK